MNICSPFAIGERARRVARFPSNVIAAFGRQLWLARASRGSRHSPIGPLPTLDSTRNPLVESYRPVLARIKSKIEYCAYPTERLKSIFDKFWFSLKKVHYSMGL